MESSSSMGRRDSDADPEVKWIGEIHLDRLVVPYGRCNLRPTSEILIVPNKSSTAALQSIDFCIPSLRGILYKFSYEYRSYGNANATWNDIAIKTATVPYRNHHTRQQQRPQGREGRRLSSLLETVPARKHSLLISGEVRFMWEILANKSFCKNERFVSATTVHPLPIVQSTSPNCRQITRLV